MNGETLLSRCPDPAANFNYSPDNGNMYGPSGIAVDPRGRIFVTDYAGRRVLTWPDVDSLQSCQPADAVIGGFTGPEAVAIDPRSETVFIADTLGHAVIGYRRSGAGWTRVATLGTRGVSGNDFNQFYFPRGLAVDADGRLYVADDFNKRILIFNPPYYDGQWASDSIGAGANGGFSSPKGLAISGHTLFVADYYNNRVLRFTGPFTTPELTYVASGIFYGLNRPVDLAVHADGSLLVTDQGSRQIVRYLDAVWSDSLHAPNGGSYFGEVLHVEPLGVACDRAGRVYVADYQAYRVIIRNIVSHPAVTFGISMEASAMLSSLYHRASLATGRVAIGQQLITWKYGVKPDPNAWYGSWLKLEQRGLPLPFVMGGELSDLMSYQGFWPNQDALNELIRHGSRQNMVTLVWHPQNPTWGDFNTPISTADLRNMTDTRTAVGQNWQVQLDRAAAVLQQFQSVRVPVLFRPLHEQNGTFFWWGHDGSSGAALRARQAAWVAMWRHMVTELTVKRGLKNLLFAFGTNHVNYEGVAAPLTYYPGGAFVDVVSMDTYEDSLNLAGDDRGVQHYAALVGTGKPFGLSEFGQHMDGGTGPNGAAWDARTLTRRIRDSYPRTVFAVAWYSSNEGGTEYRFALPDVSYTRELLTDPLIQTQTR
jgi:mannan endo-1,4-beta-mannosidase